MIPSVISAGNREYDILFFSWLLTNWCNYKCSYCYSEGSLVEKFSKMDYRDSKHKLVLTRLRALAADFKVDFGGGETTIHPYLDNILYELINMERCKSVLINTNLSRSLRYFQKLPKHDKVILSASYHAEHHNEQFIEKCIALKDNNFYCHINLSDRPEHWQNTLDLINTVKHHGVNYGFNVLYSTPFRTINYTPEFYDTFRDLDGASQMTYQYTFSDGTTEDLSSMEIYERNLHKLTGYKCTPLNYVIDFEGTINRTCNSERMPMFLKREHTHKTIICPQKECNCDILFNYYKEKPNGN